MLRFLSFACLSGLALPAVSEEFSLAATEVRVPVGETKALEFGTVPQKDTTVLLEIKARMESPGLGGSMYFLDLKLNGQPILPAKSRTVCRLINKPFESPVAAGVVSQWHGTGGWRVLYARDFEAAKGQRYYVGDPYTLVLDVTDLTNPAAENRLELTNSATPAFAKRLNGSLDLVVGALRVRTQPGASPTMAAATVLAPVINRGDPGAGPAAYKGEVLPGGGFALTVGGKRLAFDSAFSFPQAGLNRLVAGAPDAGGQAGWVVRTDRTDATDGTDGGGVVAATGPDYLVRRTIRFTPRKVEIVDEITNAHKDVGLGLLVKHTVNLKDFPEAGVRLAGNGDPSMNDYFAPANPSVHVALGEFSLGLLCEDDVFRNQARLFFDGPSASAGLRTEMLCLGPGERYPLRWSVYPVASVDYYDFINVVRQDWGANYTVEGAWCFFTPDMILDAPPDELSRQLDRLGVNYACSWGGWVDPKRDPKRIGFGAEVLSDYWADYRNRLRRATAKLHEVKPGLKVLIYYDTQRDTHEDAGDLYPDSKLTNVKGEHLSTNWSGQYSLTWSMVATAENSFGKAMLGVIDACMDEIGADGLYWDEMENVAYGYPLVTYSQWDGHSCLLDPKTYTVQAKVGLTTLLGERHRLAVMDKVRAKGGTLMGNGPTTTRALLAKHVQRMVEIQHNDYWCYEGNLDTPLGYASSRKDFGNVTRALGMATLLVGTARDYEYEVPRYLFPFTPVELHHGYLLGKERIVTTHSGRYGWPEGTAECTLRYFDKDGKLRETTQVTAGAGDGRARVDLDEGEVAVLERVP
jgi:hypothetical protein